MIASNLMGLPVLGWSSDVLPTLLVYINTMRYIIGFIAVPQQKPEALMGPQNSMPAITQAYAKYAMGSPKVSLLQIFYVAVMVFNFYFQILMCLQFTPMGASPVV